MATTRIIPMHLNKSKTIQQSLSERLNYGKNPEKTENGALISTYECDPDTADAEFALSKREYYHSTGRKYRNDVIAYQVRNPSNQARSHLKRPIGSAMNLPNAF